MRRGQSQVHRHVDLLRKVRGKQCAAGSAPRQVDSPIVDIPRELG